MQPSAIVDRVQQAGLNLQRVRATSVLVVVNESNISDLFTHPLYPLIRALAAVGVKAIYLRGAVDFFDELERITSHIHFVQEPGAWIIPSLSETIPQIEYAIELNTDRTSREICAELCGARSAHRIPMQWGSNWAGMNNSPLQQVDEYGLDFGAAVPPPQPLSPVGRVAAGMALQEVLMRAGGLDVEPADPGVAYNCGSDSRLGRSSNPAWSKIEIRDRTIDIIGCGAVGTNVVESILPVLGEGCVLRLFDNDHVGVENLSVQPVFSVGDVGQPKALVLAQMMAQRYPSRVRVEAYSSRYENRDTSHALPALRISCVDSFGSRLFLNSCSLQDSVPIVDVGVVPLAAQTRCYVPDYSPCLEHRIDELEQLAADEDNSASCARSPAPTLPGTSMIAGGLAACEALRVLQQDLLGQPSAGNVEFDARFANRFGVTDVRSACSHS